MELDLSRFRETFFQEAGEHLEAMESALLAMRQGQGETETLHAIFRGAHSMKAGAGTFGFESVARFTHVLETLLDRMRNGEVEASAARVETLLKSVDVLRGLVDAAACGNNSTPSQMEALIAELSSEKRDEGPLPSTKPNPLGDANASVEYNVRFEPSPQLLQLGLDPLLVLRDLAQVARIHTVEADLSRLPAIEQLDPEVSYLGWRLRVSSSAGMEQLRDAFAFVEDVAVVAIEPIQRGKIQLTPGAATQPQPRSAAREASIRVATEKVDRLIDLVGELVIVQSMAAEIMNGFVLERLPRLQEAMESMERYTRELQDRAMRIRMMPIGNVFSRFPRLVHDTAQARGKQVVLEIVGEDTELDKGVVERIADPLTHLVRNAIDHGIETPAERSQLSKPDEGKLRLTAYHQGGNVIVEVADDGRGLDTARIRAKAIERNLISASDELTDEQLHALVFRPGFSTADQITDLSGRGVGMDVVKRSVEALSGTVTLETRQGQGTQFRIKLPLTLAILDGQLVKVGEQTYVMPLVSIVESIRPRPEQLQGVAGLGEVVVVRKEPLPLLRLHSLFNMPTEVTDPSRGLVVIVEHEARLLAVLVDELLGQQQVVVKSLETNFHKVMGVTGATILGDGRAALILDVAGIVEMSRGRPLSVTEHETRTQF